MNGVYKVYDKEKNQWIDMPLFFKGDKGEKGDSNVYEGTGENSFALNKVSNEMVTGHYKLTYIENYKYQVITDNVDNLYDYFSEIKSKMSLINGARIVNIEKVDGQLYLTFDDYVDFYWKNPSTKVPKPINGKYFPIGYVQELETAISSNAEGEGSTSFNTGTAKGIASTAINSGRAYGNNSFAEGNGGFGNKFGKHLCADKPDANEQSGYAGAYGIASHVEGNMTMTTSSGSYAHAEGHSTVVDNFAGHAEGRETYVGGTAAHAEGNGTTSLGEGSHSEGISDKEYISYYGNGSVEDIKSKWVADKNFSIAIGNGSHVEGHNCLAYGDSSHAEGIGNNATGKASHAGGQNTEAVGDYAFAHGHNTKANNIYSVAFGRDNTSDGMYSTSFGRNNFASGVYSISAGQDCIAQGSRGIVVGRGLITNNDCESAFGKYNNSVENTVFSVGVGSKAASPKNAFEIDINGNIYILMNGERYKLQDLLAKLI